MSLADCYRTLGLGSNASPEEVRRAYKRLALKYHPDRSPGEARSHRLFCRVTAAYAALREVFAASRRGQAFGCCPSCGGLAELFGAHDGLRRCAACLLARRVKRLPMPTPRTVRCVLSIILQIVALYCLFRLIADHDLQSGAIGLIALAGAAAALTYDVLTSIVVRR